MKTIEFDLFIVNYNKMQQYKCKQHNEQQLFVCKSPQCGRFRLLCRICKINDEHHINNIITLKQAIEYYKITMKDFKYRTKQLKKQILEEIDKFQGQDQKPKGFQEFQKVLEEIMKIIKQRFEFYKKSVQTKYNNQLIKKYQAFYEDLDKCDIDEFYQTEHSPTKLKKVFKNDIDYELNYSDSYFRQLKQNKNNQINWRIDDDKVLKLITNFDNNLKELFIEKQGAVAKVYENQLHFFKDMKLFKMKQDQTITIKSLNFLAEHSKLNESRKLSLQLNSNGIKPSVYWNQQFYIFGIGSNNKGIYKFNQKEIMFKKIGEMITPRQNFSTCLMEDEVYIIGGENIEQGCIKKCEKFLLIDQKIELINSLNCRSSRHKSISYRNQYVFKFGGIQGIIPQAQKTVQESIITLRSANSRRKIFELIEEKKSKKQMCNNLIEVYNKDIDEWKKIEIMSQFTFDKQFTYWPGIIQSKQNGFIIFGGLNQYDQFANISFNVSVTFQNNEIGQIRVSKASKFAREGKYNGNFMSDKTNCYFVKQSPDDSFIIEKYHLQRRHWVQLQVIPQ